MLCISPQFSTVVPAANSVTFWQKGTCQMLEFYVSE